MLADGPDEVHCLKRANKRRTRMLDERLREGSDGYVVIRMAARSERSTEIQKRFNVANERLGEAVRAQMSPGGRVPFLCECADDLCHGRVELTLDEFEELHEDKNVYVIIPGHPRVDGEVVLRGESRFEQVEKRGQ